jgi:hypothetical protein
MSKILIIIERYRVVVRRAVARTNLQALTKVLKSQTKPLNHYTELNDFSDTGLCPDTDSQKSEPQHIYYVKSLKKKDFGEPILVSRACAC